MSPSSDEPDGEATTAVTTATVPRGRRWRRRLATAGVVLLVLGLLGGGATFGWFLRGWAPGGGVGTKTTVVTRPVTIAAQTSFHGSLPNVLGLPADEARQAYADAGVDPSRIVLHPVPYFTQVGTVVEQHPAAASKVSKGEGDVQLLVAVKARMPDLVGLTGDHARQQLADIGVGATTVVRYEAAVKPGAVAQTIPPAGAPVGPRARLVIAEAPSSIGLADLTPTSSDCQIGDADVSGTHTTGALLCELFADPVSASYAINARVTGFGATLALADGAPPGARAQLVVHAGGHVVGSFQTGAAAVPVKVALHGGTRLTLELRRLDHGDQSASVVLGDARIVGARSGIDALAKTSTP